MYTENSKPFNTEDTESTEDAEKTNSNIRRGERVPYLFNSGMSFPFGGMGIDFRNA